MKQVGNPQAIAVVELAHKTGKSHIKKLKEETNEREFKRKKRNYPNSASNYNNSNVNTSSSNKEV